MQFLNIFDLNFLVMDRLLKRNLRYKTQLMAFFD